MDVLHISSQLLQAAKSCNMACVFCGRSDDRVGRGSTAVLANAEDSCWTHGREDSDAAASIEVPIHDCKKPTCIHADEVAGKCTGCLMLGPQLVLSL